VQNVLSAVLIFLSTSVLNFNYNFNFNSIQKTPNTGVHPMEIGTVKKQPSALNVTEKPVLRIINIK
jgi:hypothetical protein